MSDNTKVVNNTSVIDNAKLMDNNKQSMSNVLDVLDVLDGIKVLDQKNKDSQNIDPLSYSFHGFEILCVLCFHFSQHLKFDWMGEVPILKEKQNLVEPVKWGKYLTQKFKQQKIKQWIFTPLSGRAQIK